MKKKVYNRKNNKNLKNDYDWDYDDNVEDTSAKKNMKPKKSITLSETEKMWKSLQNALVEKGSTPISGYPLKVGQLRSITRQFLEEQLNTFFDKLAVIFNEEYIVFKEDGFGWLRNSKLLLPLYEGTEDIIFSDVLIIMMRHVYIFQRGYKTHIQKRGFLILVKAVAKLFLLMLLKSIMISVE